MIRTTVLQISGEIGKTKKKADISVHSKIQPFRPNEVEIHGRL
jgi:hypothetical protein